MSFEAQIKQGDTLRLVFVFQDDTGLPLNLIAGGVTIRGQLRDAQGGLVATLPVTISPTVPGLVYVVQDDTTTWTPGRVLGDLHVDQNGHHYNSDTFVVRIDRSITQ